MPGPDSSRPSGRAGLPGQSQSPGLWELVQFPSPPGNFHLQVYTWQRPTISVAGGNCCWPQHRQVTGIKCGLEKYKSDHITIYFPTPLMHTTPREQKPLLSPANLADPISLVSTSATLASVLHLRRGPVLGPGRTVPSYPGCCMADSSHDSGLCSSVTFSDAPKLR